MVEFNRRTPMATDQWRSEVNALATPQSSLSAAGFPSTPG
jgi:hypothetical protein